MEKEVEGGMEKDEEEMAHLPPFRPPYPLAKPCLPGQQSPLEQAPLPGLQSPLEQPPQPAQPSPLAQPPPPGQQSPPEQPPPPGQPSPPGYSGMSHTQQKRIKRYKLKKVVNVRTCGFSLDELYLMYLKACKRKISKSFFCSILRYKIIHPTHGTDKCNVCESRKQKKANGVALSMF